MQDMFLTKLTVMFSAMSLLVIYVKMPVTYDI